MSNRGVLVVNSKKNTKSSLVYTVFDTDAGWIGLTASVEGCLRSIFPQRNRNLAQVSLGIPDDAVFAPEHFHDWCLELQAYFAGERVVFSGKIDISGGTPFQQAVWKATAGISYGQTRSYAWIARQIGKPGAARAAGQALGSNPLPIIIPCHRVIASDGKLGGFGGGLEMKKFLLDLEAKNKGS